MRLIRHFIFTLLLLSTSTASAAQFYVSTTGDDANSCTSPADACLMIQSAITKAASGDDVNIGAGTFDGGITLSNKSIYLIGAGSDQTFINGYDNNTLITIASSVNGMSTPSVNIYDLTLQDGAGSMGGAINITCSTMVNGSVNVNINRSVITGNNATNSGGAIFMNDCTSSALSIQRSSFDNNESLTTGGAIYLKGTSAGNSSLSLENVTLYQNSSAMGGSAIYLDDFADFLIGYTTISSNISTGPTPLSSTVHLNVNTGSGFIANTIIANNTGNNCPTPMSPAGSITSQGYNISSDATCTFFNESTDLNSTDPLLGTYSYGGYAIPTVPLDTGSPALNATNQACPATDARGVIRPQGSACDVGAYELQAGSSSSLVANPSSLSFSGGGTQSVMVSLQTGLPVTIFSASITGPDAAQFAISLDDCTGETLNAPGDECKIDVKDHGEGTGNYSATLVIDSSADPLEVALSGGPAGSPILDLSITGPSGTLFVGDTADYTVTLGNSGEGVAEDTVLQVTFPSNLDLQSATIEASGGEGSSQASLILPEICNYSNLMLTCNLDSIESGQQAVLYLSALITGEGSLSISASLSATGQVVSASGGSGTASAGGGLQGACSFNEEAPKSHSIFLFLVFSLVLLLACRKKSKDTGFFE